MIYNVKMEVYHSIVICFLFLLPIPHTNGQKSWYRGNTHTHTTCYDGKLSVAQAVDAYKAEGYDFLFITDHGMVCPVDDSLSDSTFLCYEGEESESYHHLSCLNIHQTIYTTDSAEIVDSTLAQGGFIIINHPLRGNHEVYVNHFIEFEDVNLIEIFNGKSEKDGYHDDQSLWDSLLSAGRLYYGVAADDMHETKHLAKGWIMVRADTLHKDSIINAIKRGDFYPSTGVTFTKMIVEDSIIQIATDDATKIEFIGDMHVTLKTVNSDTASYRINGNEGYVRAVATNAAGKKAWTQPMFWNLKYEGNPYLNTKPTGHFNPAWKVYPNPTTGEINVLIDNTEENHSYKIFNMNGKIVMSGKLENSSYHLINLEYNTKGIYILNLSSDQTIKTYKIVVIQ